MIEKELTGKRVIVLIDNLERYMFFKNIFSTCKCRSVFYLHSNAYTYFLSKERENHLLLTCSSEASKFSSNELSIEEYKYGMRFSKSLTPKVQSKLENLIASSDIFLVFSGFQYASKVISQFFSNISVIYFEIGNFPGRYQWSYFGVNADANFSLRLGRSVNIDEDEIEREINSYIPPHVNKKISSKILETLFNKVLSGLVNTLAPHPTFWGYMSSYIDVVRARSILSKLKKDSKDISKIQPGYILFIGQVEHDTQTVFQSNETGISALKKAHAYASEVSSKLVVRLHPAEKDPNSIVMILKYCYLNNIEVNNFGSLDEAIKNSSQVITINSTGGVHALILNKRVTTYGRAFYKDWDKINALDYVSNILEKN